MTDSCIWCQRTYTRNSKPCWALDAGLNLVGTVHTSHDAAWRTAHGLPWWHVFRSRSPEYARRVAWHRSQEIKPSTLSFMLFLDDDAESRQQHMDHWVQGPMQLSDAQLAQAVKESEELEQAYKKAFPMPLEESLP